jgi:uncharacterized protein (UPF0371 family)
MTRTIGFDNDLYLREQEKAILERMARFGNKLYLEFGGKFFFDYHAARVLPGYDPNVKMKFLRDLRSQADIILCIYAGDIERKKVRADMKEKILGARSVSLDLSEVLICLSINAASNPMAHLAIEKLKDLQGCEVHGTHIPTPGDEGGLRRLGINLTSDPNFATKSLFVS